MCKEHLDVDRVLVGREYLPEDVREDADYVLAGNKDEGFEVIKMDGIDLDPEEMEDLDEYPRVFNEYHYASNKHKKKVVVVYEESKSGSHGTPVALRWNVLKDRE